MIDRAQIPTLVAERIARDIFSSGDCPQQPATRIQFKCGKWPEVERDSGGLNEPALAALVEDSLIRHLREFDLL
jgi:hypothetical protein